MERTSRFGASEWTPVSIDDAVTAIVAAIQGTRGNGTVALLDQRPRRVLSSCYRQFLGALPQGVYAVPPASDEAASAIYDRMLRPGIGPWGYDLERTRTILSFGTPLFDGWGSPGRMAQLLKRKPQIIQLETRLSRTAAIASRWIPLRPRSEAALALTLASVIVREGLYDRATVNRATDFDGPQGASLRSLLDRCTPEVTAPVTGLRPEDAVALAHTITAGRPTLAIGGGNPAGGPLGRDEELAIACLNLLLGSLGTPGGLLPRRLPTSIRRGGSSAPEQHLDEIADHSVRVLIIDGAESGNIIPWALIERKLADEKALVVSLSPFMAGHTKHASIVIPSPTFLETWEDIPAPFDAAVDSWGVAAPCLTPPAGSTEPMELVRKLAAATGTALAPETTGARLSEALRERAKALHAAKHGSVFDAPRQTTTPVSDIASDEQLWSLLCEGGCWTADPAPPFAMPHFAFLGGSHDSFRRLALAAEGRTHNPPENQRALTLMPFGWRGTAGSAQLSPLMSKLYQESGVRESSNIAFVHPDTAAQQGLKNGGTALVETAGGKVRVGIRIDAGVMPGVLHVAVGPELEAFGRQSAGPEDSILTICTFEGDAVWRAVPANVWGA